jgi:NAD(P)H-hydrate epimerase
MIRLVSVDEMRAIEAAADSAGVGYAQMMENAGRAVADRLKHYLHAFNEPSVLVLVGPGNNGGDGLVAARLLAQEKNAAVTAFLARPREDANLTRAQAAGVTIVDDLAALPALVASTDVLLDALLGTGTRLPLRGIIRDVLDQVHAALRGRRECHPRSRLLAPARPDVWNARPDSPFVVAVDIPSGMDADTGALDDVALYADETVTFEAAKYGQVTFPGAEAVGALYVAPLDLPDPLPERDSISRWLVDAGSVGRLLPARPASANKGTFGKALIVGGSPNYIGAPGLAALGAYRVGAGLVTVAAPEPVVTALAGHILEVTWLPLPEGQPPDSRSISDTGASLAYTQMPGYDAMLIGPGIGRTFNVYGLIETVLRHGEGRIPPLVIDADGLNMLAAMEAWWPRLPDRTILTPHPGEMARLARIKGEGERSAAEMVQARRIALAQEKAALWHCVVVLKGAFTAIADPDGRLAVIPFADAALARAGTGDVLAGIIVGLLAQGLDPFDAAVAGAYIHGYAGRLAAAALGTRASVLAGDVAAHIHAALTGIEQVCD